jgi:hypothetical protein
VDFYDIAIKLDPRKEGPAKLYPDWIVGRSKDLMVRGGTFYAVWDEEQQIWSTDEYDVQRLVDHELRIFNEERGNEYVVQSLRSFTSSVWVNFRRYMQSIGDNSHQLDARVVFKNELIKKEDYISRRLAYSLSDTPCPSWRELMGVLYSDEERAKIEWAIGSVVSGESRYIQKFVVLYGPAGSGKSTVLDIVHKMFSEYTTTFDAKALGSSNNSFSTEVFKGNPLVAIQHDGDLSKIEDNTRLNSIVSHEEMTMNEKFKSPYTAKVNAFLFMGTNQPVKITDSKSGIIRRLIDVHPSGKTLDNIRYLELMSRIEFEYGAIAAHCLGRFRAMGKNYYSGYRPTEMMLQTDVFYNFVESIYDILKEQDGMSLKQGYKLYKEYCEDTGIAKVLPQYKFREEFRNYFEKFQDRTRVGEDYVYSYYSVFKRMSHTPQTVETNGGIGEMEFNHTVSIFDDINADAPAQLAKASGAPGKKWEHNVDVLSDLDTSELHFVQVPHNHIVIDFDLTNEDGEKDLTVNIKEAAKWPPTYAELSKSGSGIHLHYFYDGDVTELAGIYDVGIEVKTLLGGSSLRRKLTNCNNLSIATINGGLPMKEKKMLDNSAIKSEKGLRDLIERNLRKEIHPGTKSSVDFIETILGEAYESGLVYDLTDMRPTITTFAAMSTNQSDKALKAVKVMKFASADSENEVLAEIPQDSGPRDERLAFFDIEVYPNLLMICWKYAGESEVIRMINPKPEDIEPLLSMRLVGFNNRRYDNHILYAAFLGRSNEQLYDLSQRIIGNDRNASFGEAYNLSYADIYDFASKKQGLKKWQLELGIYHMEMDIPWDEPAPEEMWDKIEEYCVNDVVATEAVFEACKQDFVAREILAELSGLTTNHTTQAHTARIIFGDDKFASSKFVYTDLSEEFEGYVFDGKESTYRDEVTGEGGYVYAEPGMYEKVALLDIASMHPATIINLDLFGPYTKNFESLVNARLSIKKRDFDRARSMEILDGKLAPFLKGVEQDEGRADALSYALKIVINIVYGLTSAKFDNPFRDNRNKDNIVAKRGALFMIDLKHAVQEQGFTVAHIKTDSIKIPDATPEIIEFVSDLGSKHGYTFEHEATYEKLALVNEAVYIARKGSEYTAVGKQFQHPYVYKKLFTGEDVVFDDMCETKNVKAGVMYLDWDEDSSIRKTMDFQHVGRTGSFVPVSAGGAILWRVKDGKQYAVTGTKGWRWIERETAQERERNDELEIDMSYFDKLIAEAEEAIEFYGPYDRFVE